VENDENAEKEIGSIGRSADTHGQSKPESDRDFKPRAEDPIGEGAAKRSQPGSGVGEDGSFPRSRDGKGVLEKRSGSTIYQPKAEVLSNSTGNEPLHGRTVSRDSGTSYVEAHSGPIPSPRNLAEYESKLPGTADKLVQMAIDSSYALDQVNLADAQMGFAAAESMRTSGELAKNQQRNLRNLTWAVFFVTVVFALLGLSVPAILGLILLVAGGGAQLVQPKFVELFSPDFGNQPSTDESSGKA